MREKEKTMLFLKKALIKIHKGHLEIQALSEDYEFLEKVKQYEETQPDIIKAEELSIKIGVISDKLHMSFIEIYYEHNKYRIDSNEFTYRVNKIERKYELYNYSYIVDFSKYN